MNSKRSPHIKTAGVRASVLTGDDGRAWASAMAVPDTGNRPFAAYCHAHDVMVCDRFLTDSIRYMQHPEDFCSGCRAAIIARLDAEDELRRENMVEAMMNAR